MSTSKAAAASAATQRRRPRLRWSFFIVPLMLALLVATSASAQEDNEEEKCSDFTEDHRPCTTTEEYGYCLSNAIESYDECKEGASLLGKVGCYIAYDADFWACGLALPFWAIKSALK
ncbi:MAG: hypothetical protein WEE89_01125 [Gemmatimonadota bacterium]